MNRYHLIALPLALAGLLGACSPSGGLSSAEPSTTPHDMSTMSTVPSESREASPSASGAASVAETAEPTETPHDMSGMGGSRETVTIEIEGFAFTPAELTISAGTEVTVTNLDSAPHTFTAGSDASPLPDVFDSGLLQQGESFTFVFDEPGTFAYYCDRHPPMEGEITVTE